MRAQCTFKEQSQNIARRKISLNDHTICSYSKYKIPLEVPRIYIAFFGSRKTGGSGAGVCFMYFLQLIKKKKRYKQAHGHRSV